VPTAFKVTRSTSSSTGVVIATYQRAGKPAYGSFMLDP